LLIFVCAEPRDDTLVYVSKKKAACKRVGIVCDILNVPHHYTTKEWIELIQQQQSNYEALIIQWPINASHVSWNEVVQSIDPQRDVDCLTALNQGKLALGVGLDEISTSSDPHQEYNGFLPCTVDAVRECLDWTYTQFNIHHIPYRSLAHSNVVILGRSLLVGRPLASYFLSVNTFFLSLSFSLSSLREVF
jgi:methylenetetrahydrofolate dehydrogenase (NADP+)/methenyltetrahydrofolate cyclohydrolase